MATSYAPFANGGKQVRATLIDRIQDRWGKTVWRHDDRDCKGCKLDNAQAEPDLPDDRKQIIDPHTAYQMTSIMEGVVSRGTGTRVKEILPGVPVAGKTGTSNEEKDAWFIGLHAEPRGRRLHRLRHAKAHGQRPHGRPDGRAHRGASS